MDEDLKKKYLIGMIVFALSASIIAQNENAFRTVVILTLLISPFAVAWYVNNTAEIRRLREKIQNYRPGELTSKDVGEGFVKPSRIRLGVFGVQDSGKSTFLNSIHFAFKGVWEQVYVEKSGAAVGGETIFRDPEKLTNHITTFDTRGLVDLSATRVQEVIAELCGERGINTRSKRRSEQIDCPIFIFKYSSATGIQHCISFLMALVPAVRKKFGFYPVMVVTFADSISKKADILDEITRAGMEKTSIFFIENYTATNHEMNSKKHILLLQILEKCIKRADDIITFKWRINNEEPERRCEIM